MMSGLNQCALLLDYLMKHDTIDRRTAAEKLSVRNLSARIADMRAIGIPIECEGGYYSLFRLAKQGLKHSSSTDVSYGEDDIFPNYNPESL